MNELLMTPAKFQAELHESLLDLLDAVWDGERNWDLDDRIALGAAIGARRLA